MQENVCGEDGNEQNVRGSDGSGSSKSDSQPSAEEGADGSGGEHRDEPGLAGDRATRDGVRPVVMTSDVRIGLCAGVPQTAAAKERGGQNTADHRGDRQDRGRTQTDSRHAGDDHPGGHQPGCRAAIGQQPEHRLGDRRQQGRRQGDPRGGEVGAATLGDQERHQSRHGALVDVVDHMAADEHGQCPVAGRGSDRHPATVVAVAWYALLINRQVVSKSS
ncbi:hypothetical protein EV192_12120 [Actinocrispum wychmicini]|uniref:Uncharacterized protein n=1 Tax=Actinocrispum wychmicini TaxID=1213861 RepID=A0A4R2ILS0_9PSEU|nr:hypothetical protein EV192_12120 [Actinocrispum wychmicini]